MVLGLPSAGIKRGKELTTILSSPARTGIVLSLWKEDPKSFSELLKITGTTSGTLNYHLLKLTSEGIIDKMTEESIEKSADSKQKGKVGILYDLSPEGEKIATFVREVVGDLHSE